MWKRSVRFSGTAASFKAVATADTVVVGGGPAGLAAALRLRQYGHSVIVVERTSVDQPRIGEVVRPETRQVLTNLDLWQRFVALSPHPVTRVDVYWGADRVGRWDHICNPYGNAWTLPLTGFDSALRQSALHRGIRFRTGSVLANVVRTVDCWQLGLSYNGATETISTKFLADATGRHSAFSKKLGRRPIRFDRLICIAGVARSCGAGALVVKAQQHGWRYSVPLGQKKIAHVVVTDAANVPIGRCARARWWEGQARIAKSARLGNCASLEWMPVVRPVDMMLSSPVAGDGFLSVGDSAASLDPLSGKGVLYALEGGLSGGDAIHASIEGDRQALARYAEHIEELFSRELIERSRWYAAERRWPNSTFWCRRQ